MKPAELRPLVGRDVWLRWNGERSGRVVGAPARDTLAVELLPPYGRHRIALDDVLWVQYFGKRRTVAEYLDMRARSLRSAPVAARKGTVRP